MHVLPVEAERIPVIVLNWNGWEDTFQCLTSLRSSPERYNIWLVDNASVEDRSLEAARHAPGLRVIRLDTNYGFTGGYNRALRIARSEKCEFAYLLNNDTVVTPGFLSTVLRVAYDDSRLASVGSVIAYDGTRFVEHDGIWRSRGTKALERERVSVGSVTLRCPEFTSGAGMLVRLDAMERYGYLDDRFFFCWEDTEWCWRMERNGLPSSICLDSIVFHKGGRSDKSANANYYRTRNGFLLLDFIEDRAERRRAGRGLMYDVAVRAEFARRRKDWVSWLALAQAIDDALAGRFGKRGSTRVGWKAMARVAAWSVRAHGHDKLRALRGLPPGYGGVSDCAWLTSVGSRE